MADKEPGAAMKSRLARKDASRAMLDTAMEERRHSRLEIMQRVRSDLAALGAQMDDLDELDRYACKQVNGATASVKQVKTLTAENERLKKENGKLHRQSANPSAEQLKIVEQLAKVKSELAKADLDLIAAAKKYAELRKNYLQMQTLCTELKIRLDRKAADLLQEVQRDPGYFDELVTLRKLNASYARRIGDLERTLQMMERIAEPQQNGIASLPSTSVWG